jgi:uncharacterized protein YcbX
MEIGQVEAIFRYPVKSMRGESLEAATLGWHGLDGDRRLAFRRLDERGGFPWLSASKLPDLIAFTPLRRGDGNDEALPTHVRTPEGQEMPVFGEALAAEVGRRLGAPVEMMQLRHGIFDDGVLTFGDGDDAPAVTVTLRDVRCAMVNIDPDEGSLSPEVMKVCVRANENNAGVYGTVTRIGRLAVGQTLFLHR